MRYEQLRLDNQLCFPVYAASRLIIREYQPHLDKLGITYPQYLVLMVLWEKDGISVNDISQRLVLNTNTVTPLLKRMELQGFVKRQRSGSDERKVIIDLTQKGKNLRVKASRIPQKLAASLLSGPLNLKELEELKERLVSVVGFLSGKQSL